MKRRAFLSSLLAIPFLKPEPKTAPTVGAFTGGARYVPNTGLAVLHRGESIIPRESATTLGKSVITLRVDTRPLQADIDRMLKEIHDAVQRGGRQL